MNSGDAFAQFRSDLSSRNDYRGPIVNTEQPGVQKWLNNFFSNIKMSHSYTMSFASYGGSYQNINAYTNTMEFAFNPKLTGRVDISLLHSPFGGTNNFSDSNSDFGTKVVIQNAELNYKISDRALISIQYQQIPSYYGYNPYGYGYSRYDRYNRYGFWY